MSWATNIMQLTKLQGGGQSWYYLLDDAGRVLGAAHEDDRPKMKALENKLRNDSLTPKEMSDDPQP